MVEPVVPGGIVRRIYGHLARLLSGKAAAGLISLAYMILAAHSLGPSDYGVLILVHGFALTVGGIVEFPGWHAVVRFGARARARGDSDALLRLLRFVACVENAAGVMAIVCAAILAPLIGPRLGWSATALAFALPYSLAVLASVRSTAAGYLQLMGRFDLIGLHNIVSPTIRLIGAALCWAIGLGLQAFLVTWLLAALAEWAVMWLMGLHVARKALPGRPLIGSMKGVVAQNPGIWRFMIAANADVTFGELAGRIAPLVIGWVLGPAAVGLYAIAQRATVVIAQPSQILGQAAYAELAHLVAAGDFGIRLRRAVLHCIGIALLAAVPLFVLLVLFGRPIVMLIGGASFAGAAGLLAWLASARIVALAAPPCSAALIAMGRPGLSVSANMIAAFGLLPLLPPLLSFGPIGAGWHALLVSCVATVLLIVFVLRESRAPSHPPKPSVA